MADKQTSLEIALQWAIQAKNTLANVHGFSPAQLTFGYNPQLPSALSDKPPALSEKDLQGLLSEQLQAMRKARQAFIEAESAERVKRALRHNIRPSVNNVFVHGDLVYYKRNDCKKWRGPGRVIGTESSTVLIKHGMHYVKVHVCRVLPEKGTCYDKEVAAIKDLNIVSNAELSQNTADAEISRNRTLVHHSEDDDEV